MQIITLANIESASLFLLNCEKGLFKENLTEEGDEGSALRKTLKEKYQTYLRLQLKQPDMEREEKIKRLVTINEDMLVTAKELMAQLTEDGLKQLFIALNKYNKAGKRLVKPTSKIVIG